MGSIEMVPLQDFSKISENSLIRAELLDKIEKAPKGTVLVCSMAGYGKSTLLNQLAARTSWVAVCTLGHSDNEIAFFLSHLGEAVRQSVPEFEVDAESEHQVLQQIYQVAREKGMMLIFDNCQVIKDERVCQALQFFMSVAENSFKVVMGSREIPGFAVRFILENRCKLLQRDELALSVSEVEQIVGMYLNRDDPQMAEYLHTVTEGWAAGVMFFLRSGALSESSPVGEGLIDLGLIKKYISYEIFSDLPPDVVQFAKQASLFEWLSADICDTILETSNSQECLNFLAENEIFLKNEPKAPSTFRWIDIFQRVLLSFLTTQEKTFIAEKTVEYYLKHKMYLEAIEFALQFAQPALICRSLSVCGTSLLDQEQFELLGKCTDILENSSDELDPFIYGILAQYYYVKGDHAQMDHHFNMADSMFGKENIYSIHRTLYRGLLKFETDPSKYQKLVNNALFYLDEYNLKFPFLLPREMRVLEKIKRLNCAEEETHKKKPLKVQQFGVFKVIVAEDGHEISWRTRKASELLSYLISLNGRSVDRNHLFDVIWPDELPNNPVAMLHNMIYNIRKELSAYNLEKLINYKNKGYSIDMNLIDCTEEIVSYICAAIDRKDMDTLLENERVLTSYWGQFLENIPSLWATESGEYYDKMFVNGSLLLADFYCEHSIYEKALVFLQNAQKIDTFSERIMEKMLSCYSKLGKFDKLRLKYDEFCVMLDDELGIQPSAELKSTYLRGMQR